MGSCIVGSVLSIQEDLLSEVKFHSKTFSLALKNTWGKIFKAVPSLPTLD